MKPTLGRLVFGCILVLVSASPVLAQDPPAEDPPEQRTDSVALVFEREVFFYPQYERRNPFAPLTAGDESGPRFETLQLLGIIYYPAPGESVALFGPRAEQTQDQSQVRTYRVRRGMQLGNIRILEIQETRVVVDIEEFGMRERRIMELERPGQGGLS
jgi:hypothetical protein